LLVRFLYIIYDGFNSIFKITEKAKLKTNAHFNWDEQAFVQNSIQNFSAASTEFINKYHVFGKFGDNSSNFILVGSYSNSNCSPVTEFPFVFMLTGISILFDVTVTFDRLTSMDGTVLGVLINDSVDIVLNAVFDFKLLDALLTTDATPLLLTTTCDE
jgi:hypothetical protein